MSAGWTHMLAYDDVLAMLMVAEPGSPTTQWRRTAAATSRLMQSSRRTTQLRYAHAILDADDTIECRAFLADLHASDATVRRELVFGRYLATTSLAVVVARQVLRPAVARGEDRIARGALRAMLAEERPTLAPATRARTLSAIAAEFSRAGVVHADRDSHAPLVLTRHVPSHLALLHVLELEFAQRGDVSDDWLATSSLAAAIFALGPDVMTSQIERLIEDGRLRRRSVEHRPLIGAA